MRLAKLEDVNAKPIIPVTYGLIDKVRDALETAGETEDRNVEKEKFEEKIK